MASLSWRGEVKLALRAARLIILNQHSSWLSQEL